MGLSMAALVSNIVSAAVVEVCRGTFEPVCKPKSIISMQKQNVFFFFSESEKLIQNSTHAMNQACIYARKK